MTSDPTTLRKSIASLAVIRQLDSAGVPRYLAQWNPKWEALSSVGGHKRPHETHRACIVREIAEELEVYPHPDDPDAAAAPPATQGEVSRCRVAPQPLGMLEYEAFSRSTNLMTRYTIALFAVDLTPQAIDQVSRSEHNAWLSEGDIDRGISAEGRAVSETMRRHLDWLRGRTESPLPVFWLIAPENRLREAMSEEVAGVGGEVRFREECDFVGGHLRRMFPHAQAILIRDRLEGFRRVKRPHKLLIEVVPSADDDDRATLAPGVWSCREVYLVKVGDPNKLEEEWRGWRSCQPPGNDSIFSSLRAVRDGNSLVGLVYSDATNAIGGAAVSFEKAVRDCCRYGTPSRDSLVFTLKRLFGRLNDRFYRRSFIPKDRADHFGVDLPDSSPIRLAETRNAAGKRITQLRQRVEDAILCMRDGDHARALTPPAPLSDQERRRLRRETLATLVVGDQSTFLDPFDYLGLALENPALVPDMLVGASHGDLHGRNILVAKMEDDVGSVAVFDYGDMHLGNHIGWDFVKLETELKARVYADIFPIERRSFVREVHSFELRLAERTENIHHKRARVEDDPETDTAREELARLLLEIRRLASRGIGHDRHRPHLWLEEYYFLLLCYGSYAMQFDTYGSAEFLAAYASAGTAARRLGFPWQRFPVAVVLAQEEARRLIQSPPPGGATGLCAAARGSQTFTRLESKLGHHARLSFLREWATVDVGTRGEHLAASVQMLGELREAVPHALEIVEVLFLALLQQNDPDAVEQELADLSRRHVELPYEIECRMGRVFKDRGVHAWPADQPVPPRSVAIELGRAVCVYERAWLQSRNYYPGGNVAALHVMLGAAATAREIAGRVLAAVREARADDPWARTAQADMLYILGRDEEAAQLYAEARPFCRPQHLESSLRQLDLLLRVEPERRRFWDFARLVAIFGSESAAKICPRSHA